MREGSIRWFRQENVPGVDVMQVRGVSRKWSHFHETYTVCVRIPNGRCPSAPWLYRGREYEMGEGGTMLMEPGEFHTNTRPARAADFSVVLIEPNRFEELTLQARGTSSRPPALRTAQLYTPCVEFKIQEAVALLWRCDVVEANDALLEFVNLLSEHQAFERQPIAPSSAGIGNVRRAVEMIHERWSDTFTIGAMVAELGIPAFALSRDFRKRYGMGMRQYRKRVRLERCRRMLLSQCGTVADIAGQCGYFEPATFCREFKGLFGVTPTDYRRAILGT